MAEPFRGPLASVFGDRTAALLPPDRALPVAPASDRAAWSAADAVTVADLLARAEDDLGTPWPQPLASAAARVHRDGDRVGWETPAFARQHRLSRATVAAAATLEDRWTDEVANGVVLLLEQSSWCWPAHDDTFRMHGSVLPTVTDPFLDLGAGEVVGQLAWIDHTLGAALDERYPGLRERIRLESEQRVIDPFVRRRDWHWIGLDGDVHNWNPWIHGNVMLAALQLMAPGDDRDRVVALAIEGLDRYVASLPDDGAIDEGYLYWWNGACRALEALDVLRHASGGALDAAPAVESLRQTVAFPHRMHLGGDWYLNLADGQARPTEEQPWHALHRAARAVGDADALAHAAAHRDPSGPVTSERPGLGRLLRALTDPEWIAAHPAASPLPERVWLPSTEVLIVRERGGSPAGLTVAAKGGHNDEHHNHNDVGTFVVATDGVPVVVDAGRPTYTLQTFGPGRYDIWTMQSSWHNVPEVRGVAQGVGRAYAASGTFSAEAALTMDLAAAYPVPGLSTWRREVRLEPGRAVIEDAWQLDPLEDEPPTFLHLLLAGEVTVGEGGARVTPLEGATPVRITWPAEVPATTTVRELDDPILAGVWGARLTRLELRVTGRATATVAVEQDRRTEDGR